MAKTLLQYSCLYILPFLFGVCMCGGGIEDKEFPVTVVIDQKAYVGRGRIQPGKRPQQGQSKKDIQHTQVIISSKNTFLRQFDSQDQVTINFTKGINTLNNEQVKELMKRGYEPANLKTFHINEHFKVEGYIHCKINVLPFGSSYPDIYLQTPRGVGMYGYQMGRQLRFLGDDSEKIHLLEKCVSEKPDDLKIILFKKNGTVEYHGIKVNLLELKVYGEGCILDLVFQFGNETDPFDIPV